MTKKPLNLSIPPQPKREVKKLTIKITDQDALLAAYPMLKIETVVITVDRSALRKIIKARQALGMDGTPGVEAFYASEKAAEVSSGS